MEQLKKQILHLLEENTIDETSSTGTTGERIIYAPYNDIVDDIIKMVSDNFEPKKCMPEGINSKEEHEEYLKAIGYEKYVKDLQHFKDSSIGLYVTDKPIGDLLQMFWQRSSDACPLECSEAEKQEAEFKEWVKSVSWVLS